MAAANVPRFATKACMVYLSPQKATGAYGLVIQENLGATWSFPGPRIAGGAAAQPRARTGRAVDSCAVRRLLVCST